MPPKPPTAHTRKLFIKTYGCQMNEYDSSRISEILADSHNLELTSNPEEADVLLLNTCSIREKAQEKVFSQLGRWKNWKNDKPDLVIGVGGCVASQEGAEIQKRAPYVEGYVMTGFAWMQLGYTQIDLPLSGFAPIFGNHAVGGLIAICAGALVLLVQQCRQINFKFVLSVVLPVVLLWLGGSGLKTVNWTDNAGDVIKVSVIQGNIAQKDKWKSHMKQLTLDRYRDLSLAQQDVDLIVWPETAVPDYMHRVPA